MNQVDFDSRTDQSAIEFVYYAEPVLRTVSPKSSSIKGGETITLQGVNLLNAAFRSVSPNTVVCKFGKLLAIGRYNDDDQAIECETPKVVAPTSVELELSLNDVDFTSSAPVFNFLFFDPPIVYSIFPEAGSKEAQTLVTVYGEGFRRDTGDAKCRVCQESNRFVSGPAKGMCNNNNNNREVPATVLNAGVLTCAMPRMVQGVDNEFFQAIRSHAG